jgi:hypothetical protein
MLFAGINCVESYDFVPAEPGRYLVVSGVISQTDEENRVVISWSTAFGTNAFVQPVEYALVTLYDEFGNSEILIHEANGSYVHYLNTIRPQTGGSYFIEILLGNKVYKCAPQTMPEPVVPDSVSIAVGTSYNLNDLGNEVSYSNMDVFINTPINTLSRTSYLRWKVDESWSFGEISCGPLHISKTCYIENNVNDDQIYLFSSEGISGAYLFGKKVVGKNITDRFQFLDRHYINVNQYTLTADAYEYWAKAKKLSYPEGSIFDLPPAALPGNVYNTQDPDELVLGYIEFSAKAVARVYLFKSDLAPFTVTSKEYQCYWEGHYEACCECLTIKNSSTVRPDYWD